jgi:cyclic pyranopterin phosphate synthase
MSERSESGRTDGRSDPDPQVARDAHGRSGLWDAPGRRVRYLRVSLTDLCNLRCRYCMPPEGVVKMSHEEMLRLEELAAVVRIFVARLGIEKVRVTGGEPLVRHGALAFLQALGAIPGLRDLALTTNASFLAELAEAVRQAGVRRVNISLDTLRPDAFRRITGIDGLDRVLAGIEAATRAGFEAVKLNAVILPETVAEAPALVRFAATRGIVLRFIERMPAPGTDGGAATDARGEAPDGTAHGDASARSVMDALRREFEVTPVDGGRGADTRATAALYRVAGPGLPAATTVGFITPVSAPFCRDCDRIRLRGDGRLLPCLSQAVHFDLEPYIRPVLRETELVEFVREAMAGAKADRPQERRIQAMWRIGG